MAIYEDIKLMDTKYTVYNNFNNFDDYILTFDYHGTSEELSTRKDVDKFHVNFISRYDTKFRFRSCDTEGIIYEIDGSCDKTRERVRVFKHDEDGYYEYHWCSEVKPPFDTDFFKVGHPYLVNPKNMKRKKALYPQKLIPMLLISMDADALYFGYYDHDKDCRFNVTSYEYYGLTVLAKHESFLPLMVDDVWKD